jgi:hypothetical protein
MSAPTQKQIDDIAHYCDIATQLESEIFWGRTAMTSWLCKAAE